MCNCRRFSAGYAAVLADRTGHASVGMDGSGCGVRLEDLGLRAISGLLTTLRTLAAIATVAVTAATLPGWSILSAFVGLNVCTGHRLLGCRDSFRRIAFRAGRCTGLATDIELSRGSFAFASSIVATTTLASTFAARGTFAVDGTLLPRLRITQAGSRCHSGLVGQRQFFLSRVARGALAPITALAALTTATLASTFTTWLTFRAGLATTFRTAFLAALWTGFCTCSTLRAGLTTLASTF